MLEGLTVIRNVILVLGLLAGLTLLILKMLGKEDPTKRRTDTRPTELPPGDAPGTCKVCRFENAGSAQRCEQCGNLLR